VRALRRGGAEAASYTITWDAAFGRRFDDLTGTALAGHLRTGLVTKTSAVMLEGVDEVYVVAGHKGNLAAVAKKAAAGDGGASRAHPASLQGILINVPRTRTRS
jgi:hypothetical protein